MNQLKRGRHTYVMRILKAACLLLLTCLATAQTATAPETKAAAHDWKTTDDDWYILEIGGAKAGWMNIMVQEGGDQIRTTIKTQMKIDRGQIPIEIKLDSAFIESADGKPISCEMEQNMATQAVHTRWDFQAEHVLQTTDQGGPKTTKPLPLPKGEWLTTAAADRYSKQRRKEGATEITYRSIDPQTGLQPITITSKRIGEGEFTRDGKTIPVTLWSTKTDVIPMPSSDRYDPDGNLVLQETETGFGKITMRLATREQAQASSGGAVPEVLLSMTIKPDKPIENVAKLVQAKFRVHVKDGTMPQLPSAGAQHVEAGEGDKSAILTIDLRNNVPATDAEIANKEYRDASAMVDADDPIIKKLAKDASERTDKAEAADDTMRRAETLRRLVHRHINKKGMETAFASASETAKTRTGDCSEHGVLLCALLRAAGIPARVATGLIYVDGFAGQRGIFGWHMWTQALIDGKWVDLDATLPQNYHAAHILTATSSLADGVGVADLASMLQLIGNLEIDVMETGYEQK